MRHLVFQIVALTVLVLTSGLMPAIVQAGGTSSSACSTHTVCDHALGVALLLPTGWIQLHPPKVPPHEIDLVRPTQGPSYDMRLVIRSLGTTADRNNRRAASTAATAFLRSERATRVARTPVRYGGAPGILLSGMPATPAPALEIVLAHGGALYLIIAPGTTLATNQRVALTSLHFIPRVGAFPSSNPPVPSAPSARRSGTSTTAATLPQCRTVIAPALVYALNSAMYRADSNGRNLCRFGTAVDAKEPQLSPGGARVAFLSGVGSHGDGQSHGNSVRVILVGGPVASGTVIPVGQGLHGELAWSPDGQKLAFMGQSGVWVWRVACGCVRLVLPSKGSTLQASFAWSPDSRRMAAYLLPAVPSPSSTRLVVQVADLTAGRRSTVTVRFPSWLVGPRPYAGAYPSGVVAWLPNGDLLLRTSGWGVGVPVTSLWRVPWNGGMARMIVGTHNAQHLGLTYPLLNSSQALVSPNGGRLLLDPYRALWIGSTARGGGWTITLPISGSCALSQIAWVGNGHLAYVTVCSLPGEGTIPILARLYVLSLTGGAPVQVASVRSQQQDTLSIEAPTRCIACGAG